VAKSGGKGTSGRSQRRHKRVAKRLTALVYADGDYANGHVKNLSKMGLFVRSNMMPPPGTEVRIRFETITGEKIDVEGVVRWNTSGMPRDDSADGFGVHLPKPSKDYLNFFAKMAGSKKRRQ